MRGIQKFNFVSIIPFLLFFAVAANLNSQEKRIQKEFQHEAVVTLKLIQVFVTDDEGHPVTDLKKEDFILKDNKELKEITDFESHFAIIAKTVKRTAQITAQDKKSEPALPTAQLSRKFFLFLDIQRNDPIGILKSKRIARYFVENQIHPGDEVGIFSFQPTAGFVLHEFLTSDKNKMLAAIKKARAFPVTLDYIIPLNTEGPSWSDYAKPLFLFFYALEDLSQSLQYISGIKNIVLFSKGGGGKTAFDRLGSMLASANCRVYTVDTNWKYHYLKDYFETGQGAALKQLAISSGGKHFRDPDDFETISEEIQQMTGNYYVLGYYIQQEWNSEYHEIEVKVKREGCVVYAQKGYYNPKPFSEFTEGEKRLHLADIAMNDTPYFEAPKPFPLEALPFPGEETSKLVLLSEIRPENLEEVFLDDTEIITLIMDREENIVDARRAVLKKEALKRTPIHHYSITRLKPGSYECRVIIRNLETGKSALGSSSVEVPILGESKLTVFPLFLFIPEKESLFIRTVRADDQQEKKALSLSDIYPYLSNRHSPLVAEVDRSERRLFAILRFSSDKAGQEELNIVSELIHNSSGRKAPIEFQILEKKKFGLDDAMLLEIKLPFVEPDVYTLNITLKEPQLGREVVTSRTFRIR